MSYFFRPFDAFIALACLGLIAGCSGDVDPGKQCAGIATGMHDGVSIDIATIETDRDDLPGFCRIAGTIEPNIGFEARFPLENWNGKYYQSGCGGYCGRVLPDKPGFSNTINEALKRGYATITTDGGHSASNGDPSWAKDNPEALEVYAHRAIPLTHKAGTGLVNAFYRLQATREYFGGCSNGGRMAAMAAQRYPGLFDGILGGSGVLNLSKSGGIYGSWVVQSNSDEQGNRVLTRRNFAAKIPLLESEVLLQCDGVDGATDGIISSPRRCEVDFDALPGCNEEGSEQCFTEREKRVLRAWYQGPRNSNGEQLFPGMPPGGERYAGLWFLDTDERVAIGNQLGGGYAKYMGFEGGTAGNYTALDFDFDKDPARLEKNAEFLDAMNPDLRSFRDSGGKYLMWHGWGDALVLPDQSLGYYESVAASMGGFDEIKSFFRLFMLPGHGHCWEIPANVPDRFDPITVLDQWVETGDAPQSIPTATFGEDATVTEQILLCPHPDTARVLKTDSDATAQRCDNSE